MIKVYSNKIIIHIKKNKMLSKKERNIERGRCFGRKKCHRKKKGSSKEKYVIGRTKRHR